MLWYEVSRLKVFYEKGLNIEKPRYSRKFDCHDVLMNIKEYKSDVIELKKVYM